VCPQESGCRIPRQAFGKRFEYWAPSGIRQSVLKAQTCYDALPFLTVRMLRMISRQRQTPQQTRRSKTESRHSIQCNSQKQVIIAGSGAFDVSQIAFPYRARSELCTNLVASESNLHGVNSSPLLGRLSLQRLGQDLATTMSMVEKVSSTGQGKL